MKTNSPSINIQRDLIKRKHFLKNELKLIILTSIIRNQNVQPIIRAYIWFKLIHDLKIKSRVSRQHNVCLITGKQKTTFSVTNLSRQITKKLIELGLAKGFKTYSK